MRKNKFFTYLLLSTIFLGFTLQATTLPIVHGSVGTIYSKYTENPPTLNGGISAAEWEDANVYMDVGNEDKFDVFLMHDDNYFYIGIRADNPTQSDTDRLCIFFDEGDDGGYGSGSSDEILTSGQEDYAAIDGDGTLRDGYWKGPDPIYWYVYTTPDAVTFEAEMNYHVNRWEAEFKIPFVGDDGHSGDVSDLDIDMNAHIGILIRLRDYDNGFTGHYWYPEYSYTDATHVDIQADPSSWVTLAFDNEAPAVSNVVINPSQPGPDDSVTVTADVTDDVSGILDVILRYSINSGASWTNVVMTSGSAYSGVIPKQAEDTVVQVKVVARDNAGFVTETPVTSYSVQTPAPEAPGIPGFPLEAIALAMIMSVVALMFFKKREQLTPAGI